MNLCDEGRKCRTQETGRESALTFITGNLQRRQKTNTESGESWTRKHKTKGYTAGIWGITQQGIQINKGRNCWNEYTWWHKGKQIECHAHGTRDYHNKTGNTESTTNKLDIDITQDKIQRGKDRHESTGRQEYNVTPTLGQWPRTYGKQEFQNRKSTTTAQTHLRGAFQGLEQRFNR